MTFDQWLSKSGMDDGAAAKLFSRDRAHISKLRRGKSKPSYELMLEIRDASGGQVDVDSWASRKMARAGGC